MRMINAFNQSSILLTSIFIKLPSNIETTDALCEIPSTLCIELGIICSSRYCVILDIVTDSYFLFPLKYFWIQKYSSHIHPSSPEARFLFRAL